MAVTYSTRAGRFVVQIDVQAGDRYFVIVRNTRHAAAVERVSCDNARHAHVVATALKAKYEVR